MHPIFIKLGPLTIHTYGLAIALAFLAGTTLSVHLGKREGQNPQLLYDLIFYAMLAAIIGSRLLYVLTEYRHYINDPLRIFKLWEGGLVFYGGLIAAVGVGFVFMWRQGMPVWATTDILAPGISLGQAIGRVGCLMAGCCYGAPTHAFWGITFSDPDCLAPVGIKLHPAQIYSSLESLAILGVLMWLRKHRSFEGQIFWAYIGMYSVTRFIIEFFRGDERGGIMLGNLVLSTSQFISLLTLITAVVMYLKLRSKSNSVGH